MRLIRGSGPSSLRLAAEARFVREGKMCLRSDLTSEHRRQRAAACSASRPAVLHTHPAGMAAALHHLEQERNQRTP